MFNESDFDFDKPYILTSPKGYVVDKSTGEIIFSVLDASQEKIKKIRTEIDWRASLEYCSERMGHEFALAKLDSLYHLCYWEYPDYHPGFLTDPPKQQQNDNDDINRGLSNTNKVHEVILRNKHTGQYIYLKKREARLPKMRRRVFAWADTLKGYLNNIERYRKVMITLTYAGVGDWQANDIRDYMKALKRKLGDNLIACAWVSELQKRGAVHYHVMLVCKRGTRIPKPDESGMWKHGMSRIETAKTVFYLCSYLKKTYQKEGEFPKGMRMYSVWIAKWAVKKIALWRMRISVCQDG